MTPTTAARVAPLGRLHLTLRDHLVLILVELAGGPVPVKLILKRLEDAGWRGENSAVTQALRRNPHLFRNVDHGMYALNLGNGNGWYDEPKRHGGAK